MGRWVVESLSKNQQVWESNFKKNWLENKNSKWEQYFQNHLEEENENEVYKAWIQTKLARANILIYESNNRNENQNSVVLSSLGSYKIIFEYMNQ